MEKPYVSVIVPVYNDPERVKTCLNALEEQTYPSNSYEVILVDNNSEFKADLSSEEFPHLVYTEEKIQGPSAARNKGVKTAKGEVIAFTDADCIPAEDWIENGCKHLTEQQCGLLVGNVDMYIEDEDNPKAVELWECLFILQQKNHALRYNFGATANVFTTREVIDSVGMFNEKLLTCEDREWGNRIHNNGYEVCYADDVVVRHPARKTFNDLYRRQLRIVAGAHAIHQMKEYPYCYHVKSIVRDIIPPVGGILQILTSKKIKRFSDRIKVAGLHIFIRLLWVIERIRLMLGASPKF